MVTTTLLSMTLIGLLTACLFIYTSSRHMLLSAIFGVATMSFYLAAFTVLASPAGFELTAMTIATSVIYFASFFAMAAFLGVSIGMREEPARMNSVFVALLTIILFYIVFYGVKTVEIFGTSVIGLTLPLALASAIATMFVLLLERDVAKMGMCLLMCIYFLHMYIPEVFEPASSAVSFACIVAVGVTVYYVYKEFSTKNVDSLMKLRY